MDNRPGMESMGHIGVFTGSHRLVCVSDDAWMRECNINSADRLHDYWEAIRDFESVGDCSFPKWGMKIIEVPAFIGHSQADTTPGPFSSFQYAGAPYHHPHHLPLVSKARVVCMLAQALAARIVARHPDKVTTFVVDSLPPPLRNVVACLDGDDRFRYLGIPQPVINMDRIQHGDYAMLGCISAPHLWFLDQDHADPKLHPEFFSSVEEGINHMDDVALTALAFLFWDTMCRQRELPIRPSFRITLWPHFVRCLSTPDHHIDVPFPAPAFCHNANSEKAVNTTATYMQRINHIATYFNAALCYLQQQQKGWRPGQSIDVLPSDWRRGVTFLLPNDFAKPDVNDLLCACQRVFCALVSNCRLPRESQVMGMLTPHCSAQSNPNAKDFYFGKEPRSRRVLQVTDIRSQTHHTFQRMNPRDALGALASFGLWVELSVLLHRIYPNQSHADPKTTSHSFYLVDNAFAPDVYELARWARSYFEQHHPDPEGADFRSRFFVGCYQIYDDLAVHYSVICVCHPDLWSLMLFMGFYSHETHANKAVFATQHRQAWPALSQLPCQEEVTSAIHLQILLELVTRRTMPQGAEWRRRVEAFERIYSQAEEPDNDLILDVLVSLFIDPEAAARAQKLHVIQAMHAILRKTPDTAFQDKPHLAAFVKQAEVPTTIAADAWVEFVIHASKAFQVAVLAAVMGRTQYVNPRGDRLANFTNVASFSLNNNPSSPAPTHRSDQVRMFADVERLLRFPNHQVDKCAPWLTPTNVMGMYQLSGAPPTVYECTAVKRGVIFLPSMDDAAHHRTLPAIGTTLRAVLRSQQRPSLQLCKRAISPQSIDDYKQRVQFMHHGDRFDQPLADGWGWHSAAGQTHEEEEGKALEYGSLVQQRPPSPEYDAARNSPCYSPDVDNDNVSPTSPRDNRDYHTRKADFVPLPERIPSPIMGTWQERGLD